MLTARFNCRKELDCVSRMPRSLWGENCISGRKRKEMERLPWTTWASKERNLILETRTTEHGAASRIGKQAAGEEKS